MRWADSALVAADDGSAHPSCSGELDMDALRAVLEEGGRAREGVREDEADGGDNRMEEPGSDGSWYSCWPCWD